MASTVKVPWRSLRRLALLALLILAANLAAHWIAEALAFDLRPSNEPMVHRMIMVSAAVYALLLAIPFVPGVEIGLAMIGMLGPPIALLVYLCTVLGLSVSFAIGRLIPTAAIAPTLEDLHLYRAGALLRRIEPMSVEERLSFLVERAPNRLVPLLIRHRCLALAVALNIPGNVIIGGGGGIALVAGVSRIYSVPGFFATVVMAVAPVPLAILIFGTGVVGL